MAAARDDVEATRLSTLGPLVRGALILRLLILLLGSLGLSSNSQTTAALALLVLMTLTSAGPVISWRRWGNWILHHPITMVLDLLVALAVLLVVPTSLIAFGYAVATAALSGILYGRTGGFILTGPLLAARLVQLGTEPWPEVIAATALLAVATAVGDALRVLVLDLHQAREDVRAATQTLVTARERDRLARELHDSVAKTIQGVGLTARALERVSTRPEQVTELSRQIADDADLAVREARALLHGLRLDDVQRPLDESVQAIVSSFGRLNALDIDVRARPITCDDDVRYEVVQVLREALRNVDDHALATGVVVDLGPSEDDGFRLVIRDDGRGFDPDGHEAGHYGLCGMSERAVTIGGSLDVCSAPGRGTTITLTGPGAPQPSDQS